MTLIFITTFATSDSISRIATSSFLYILGRLEGSGTCPAPLCWFHDSCWSIQSTRWFSRSSGLASLTAKLQEILLPLIHIMYAFALRSQEIWPPQHGTMSTSLKSSRMTAGARIHFIAFLHPPIIPSHHEKHRESESYLENPPIPN